MRAARQQGSLRLLACLADAPLAASALAADPAVLSQQQVAGLRTVAAVGWLGLASQVPLAAATAAPGRQLQAGPLGKQQQRLEQQQQLPHLLQQRHGMAMKVSGFRPKRRDQGPAERNLPARNEEITAPEVGGGSTLLFLLFWLLLGCHRAAALRWRWRDGMVGLCWWWFVLVCMFGSVGCAYMRLFEQGTAAHIRSPCARCGPWCTQYRHKTRARPPLCVQVRVLYADPANPEEQRSEVMTLRRALK